MKKKTPNKSWESTDSKPNEPTTIQGRGGQGENRVCSTKVPSWSRAPYRDHREGLQHALRGTDEDVSSFFSVQGSATAVTRAAEGTILLVHAQKIGALLDSEDFIRRWKESGELSGSEHQIIIGDNGQPVEKRTNIPLFHGSWLNYFERIELHNQFFPETLITVKGVHNQPDWVISDRRNQLGFTRQLDPGMLYRLGYASAPSVYVVTEQPFVRFDRDATKNEISEFLISRGFIKAASPDAKEEWYNAEAGVFLEDAHPRNIVIRESNGEFTPVAIDVPLRHAEEKDSRLIERTLKRTGGFNISAMSEPELPK